MCPWFKLSSYLIPYLTHTRCQYVDDYDNDDDNNPLLSLFPLPSPFPSLTSQRRDPDILSVEFPIPPFPIPHSLLPPSHQHGHVTPLHASEYSLLYTLSSSEICPQQKLRYTKYEIRNTKFDIKQKPLNVEVNVKRWLVRFDNVLVTCTTSTFLDQIALSVYLYHHSPFTIHHSDHLRMGRKRLMRSCSLALASSHASRDLDRRMGSSIIVVTVMVESRLQSLLIICRAVLCIHGMTKSVVVERGEGRTEDGRLEPSGRTRLQRRPTIEYRISNIALNRLHMMMNISLSLSLTLTLSLSPQSGKVLIWWYDKHPDVRARVVL